jgi:hypothetical protein
MGNMLVTDAADVKARQCANDGIGLAILCKAPFPKDKPPEKYFSAGD